jgi:hypothetical protein
MTPAISSQVYDLHQQGGSLPPPSISAQAAPTFQAGASSSSTPRTVHAGSTITAPTIAGQPSNGTGGLKGLAPSIFYGDRNRSDLFLKEFKQWKMINRNADEMKVPYNRVLMALSYIKGERVNDWQEEQLNKLDQTTLSHTDETLWTNFETAFKGAFTDSNKKQTAYEKLKEHKMIGDDVDSYISQFENLIAKAGWSRTDAGTIDLFQEGLKEGLKRAILLQDKWPETLQEWEDDARRQTNRHKTRMALLKGSPSGQRGGQSVSKNQSRYRQALGLPNNPPAPRRHPDAMDVDNSQTEANAATRQQQRERYRREGRCMQCGQFGHFAKNCPRGQPSQRLPQRTRGNQNPQRPLPNPPGPAHRSVRNQLPPPAYSPRRAATGQAGVGPGPTHYDADTAHPVVDDRSQTSEAPAPTDSPPSPQAIGRVLRDMTMEQRESVWEELQKEGEDFA